MYARNCTSKMFTWLLSFWLLPTTHSRGRRSDFHTQYIKRRGSTQGCAFSGSEDQNLTRYPSYSRKPPFLGPLLMGLRNWPKSGEDRFTMGITLLHIPVTSMSCRVISPFFNFCSLSIVDLTCCCTLFSFCLLYTLNNCQISCRFKAHCKGDSHSCNTVKYHFARIQDKTMVNNLKCTSEIVFKFNCMDVVWNNSSHRIWIQCIPSLSMNSRFAALGTVMKIGWIVHNF